MTILTSFADRCGPVYALAFSMLAVSAGLPRRSPFVQRVLPACGIFLAASLLPLCISFQGPAEPYVRTLYHFLMFFLLAALLWMCLDVSFPRVLYSATLGLLLQYFLYSTSEVFLLASYLSGKPIDPSVPSRFLPNVLVYALVYGAAALFFRHRRGQETILVRPLQILPPILLLPVAAQVMNMLIERSSLDPLQMLYYRLYSVMICVSTFFLMVYVFENSRIRREMELIQQANARQKEQYEIKKDLIDMINLRAHDLKKQLERLGGSVYDKGGIQQVEENLAMYDFMADTGNEVLDVILTDVGLRCEKENIRLTYLLDGRQLDFLDPMDMYAIFGNLFDNALESVRRLKDPEKRVISLKMRVVGNMLFFHAFNYFDDDLQYENGLPLTTKEDRSSHGFGMKSIRMSVRKYGGDLTITAENHIFNVNFMLCRDPVPVAAP